MDGSSDEGFSSSSENNLVKKRPRLIRRRINLNDGNGISLIDQLKQANKLHSKQRESEKNTEKLNINTRLESVVPKNVDMELPKQGTNQRTGTNKENLSDDSSSSSQNIVSPTKLYSASSSRLFPSTPIRNRRTSFKSSDKQTDQSRNVFLSPTKKNSIKNTKSPVSFNPFTDSDEDKKRMNKSKNQNEISKVDSSFSPLAFLKANVPQNNNVKKSTDNKSPTKRKNIFNLKSKYLARLKEGLSIEDVEFSDNEDLDHNTSYNDTSIQENRAEVEMITEREIEAVLFNSPSYIMKELELNSSIVEQSFISEASFSMKSSDIDNDITRMFREQVQKTPSTIGRFSDLSSLSSRQQSFLARNRERINYNNKDNNLGYSNSRRNVNLIGEPTKVILTEEDLSFLNDKESQGIVVTKEMDELSIDNEPNNAKDKQDKVLEDQSKGRNIINSNILNEYVNDDNVENPIIVEDDIVNEDMEYDNKDKNESNVLDEVLKNIQTSQQELEMEVYSRKSNLVEDYVNEDNMLEDNLSNLQMNSQDFEIQVRSQSDIMSNNETSKQNYLESKNDSNGTSVTPVNELEELGNESIEEDHFNLGDFTDDSGLGEEQVSIDNQKEDSLIEDKGKGLIQGEDDNMDIDLTQENDLMQEDNNEDIDKIEDSNNKNYIENDEYEGIEDIINNTRILNELNQHNEVKSNLIETYENLEDNDIHYNDINDEVDNNITNNDENIQGITKNSYNIIDEMPLEDNNNVEPELSNKSNRLMNDSLNKPLENILEDEIFSQHSYKQNEFNNKLETKNTYPLTPPDIKSPTKLSKIDSFKNEIFNLLNDKQIDLDLFNTSKLNIKNKSNKKFLDDFDDGLNTIPISILNIKGINFKSIPSLFGRTASKNLPPFRADSGIEVPNFPNKALKQIALQSLSNSVGTVKLSKDSISALNQATQLYFQQTAKNLAVYAKHANRKTIENQDVELLLKRQGYISNRQNLSTLLHRTLPRELIDPVEEDIKPVPFNSKQ